LKKNQKLNRKNLILSLFFTIVFIILYWYIFQGIKNKIPNITLITWTIGIFILTILGLLVLFPIYEKEKKKKKKNNYFKKAIMDKRK